MDVRLIRCYPVYKGETEAQAYKLKLAEEKAQKGSRNVVHEYHTDHG